MNTTIATLLLFITSLSFAQSCSQGFNPRCYCSSASDNDRCTGTQRITYIAANTASECDSYCKLECGDSAGSDFACYPGEEPLTPCNARGTTCDCGCSHNVAVPSPMQFGGQCFAFCERRDVCGQAEENFGVAFSCGWGPGDGSSAVSNSLLISSGALAAAVFMPFP